MFLLTPLILTLADIILAGTLREELVYPELLQQRSDDGSLLLQINHDMTLYLRKSSVLANDLFLTTKAGGQSKATLWNGSRIQENLYHDSKHQSSLMLYQGDHELKVEGIITATLRIKPVESSERSGDARILHKVYEIEDPKRYFGKALGTWTSAFNIPWFKFPWEPQSQTPSPKLPTAAQVPEEYVAEVHVVSCSVHERQFKADEDLIAYVAILMNAVNIWYEGMDNPRLRTKVVGITRNKDGESEVRRDGFLIADRTINRIVDDAEMSIPGAPDAVYLMTSQDLAYVSPSGSVDGSVAGLAFVGQLCSSRNVAIGEDPAGSFKGVYPAAHELAHVFGSAHDGEPGVSHIPDNPGAKDCPWEEGYLMSYADGGTKKFQMSPCTKAQIRAQLSDLPQSCLDEVSNINYMANYKQVPGQQISPEDYCNVVTKNRGVPLLQQDMLKQCRFQCCVRTYYGPGECSTEYALEGMTCDTGKTCRKGVCGDFNWES